MSLSLQLLRLVLSGVTLVGIDETQLRKGQDYVTVVHDLDGKRLLYATPGKDHNSCCLWDRRRTRRWVVSQFVASRSAKGDTAAN